MTIKFDDSKNLPLRLLLEPRQRARFTQALEHAFGAGGGDGSVHEALQNAALSENERLLFSFAWSLVRGWGAGLHPDHLWGMDPQVATHMLASMVAIINPENPQDLVEAVAGLLRTESTG